MLVPRGNPGSRASQAAATVIPSRDDVFVPSLYRVGQLPVQPHLWQRTERHNYRDGSSHTAQDSSRASLFVMGLGISATLFFRAQRRQRRLKRGDFSNCLGSGEVSAVLQDGETVAVIGAGGNVGRLVTQALCESGKYQVRAVLRDPDAARSSWGENAKGCEFFRADTRDYAALAEALRDANSVICTTGVPAFGISGQWERGNHPESVDHFGVKNAVHAWAISSAASADAVKKRRFVLMSSVGVTRRDSFPYAVLNGGGVLDAKAAGEAALRSMAKQQGFAFAVVRPGQLFGGPYANNRYLGTLFQLDKDAATRRVQLTPGDTAVGDTLRSALAGVLVQCLFCEARALDFVATSEDGPATSEEDVDGMLRELASQAAAEFADEQLEKRARLAASTLSGAVENVVSGKVFDR